MDGTGGGTHVASVGTDRACPGPARAAGRVGRVSSPSERPQAPRRRGLRWPVAASTRSRASPPAASSRPSTRRSTTWCRSASPPTVAGCSSRRSQGSLALGPQGELPSVTGKREVALTPGQGLVVTDPGDVPDVLGEVDVVFPVMHGPVGPGRHAAGAARDGRRPLRRRRRALQRGRHRQALHEAAVHGRRAARAALRAGAAAPVGARPGRDPGGGRGARLPGLRQAGPGRVQLRHQPGRRRRRPRRGDRGGAPVRPEGARRGRGHERARGRDRGAPGPRRRRSRDQRHRRDHGGAGAHVLRLRGEVPRAELPHPGLAQRGRHRAGRARSPYARSRPSTSRASPASTSS